MPDLPTELRRIADIELVGYSEKMMRHAADEIERLRAQITDLTRLAGCAAVGRELSDIKKELRNVE